jgi:hypothetical protein
MELIGQLHVWAISRIHPPPLPPGERDLATHFGSWISPRDYLDVFGKRKNPFLLAVIGP